MRARRAFSRSRKAPTWTNKADPWSERLLPTGPGSASSGSKRPHLDHRSTPRDDAKTQRRHIGQIDDPIRFERPAVVDPHHHARPILEIGHPRISGQRQGAVGGGVLEHVIGLEARGRATVKLRSVPGGEPALDVALLRSRAHDRCDHGRYRGVIPIAAARLRPWNRFGNLLEVDFHPDWRPVDGFRFGRRCGLLHATRLGHRMRLARRRRRRAGGDQQGRAHEAQPPCRAHGAVRSRSRMAWAS